MTNASTSTRRGPVVLVLILIAILLAGGGLWYLFLRPAGPAPVSLGEGSPTVAPSTGPSGPTSTTPVGTPAGSSAGSDPGSGDGIDGTWTVDSTVGSFDDFSGSFVGYRVRETLATIGATEAVGRTPEVTGSVTVEGTVITGAEFSADLTGLESDDSRRDGQLDRQALETSQFPTAMFTLATPVDLGLVPADGATFEVVAVGDLTLHGVTKVVEIPLQARLQDGVVTITGSLEIAFADYGIAKPEAMIVLSVEDRGTLELQLQLTRT